MSRFLPPDPRTPLRRTCREGFTLLELVIVLFVVALAGAIVYPDLRPMLDGARLSSTVRRTATFLDGIRSSAVLGGKTLAVALDEDGREIVVTTEGEEEDGAAGGLEITGGSRRLVERLVMEPERILYFPGGASSGGEVSFTREGQVLAAVRVGSFTGLAAIVEEER